MLESNDPYDDNVENKHYSKTVDNTTLPAISLTMRNFLLTFKEFFIVWVNQILYYDRVYSKPIFDKFKSFNLIIFKNRYPNFDKYLNDLIDNILQNLVINKDTSKNNLKTISCLIYNNKSNEVIKKYSINFYQFIVNLDKTIFDLNQEEHEDTSAVINLEGFHWNEIYTQFNNILFNHIQELKKSSKFGMEEALSSNENYDDFQKTYNMSAAGKDEINNEELFFKITVEIDKSIYITKNNWTRLSSTKEGEEEVIADGASKKQFRSIGKLDLNILNMDLSNEYY